MGTPRARRPRSVERAQGVRAAHCARDQAPGDAALARLVNEVNEGAHPTTKSGTVGVLLEQWFTHNEADWSPTVVVGYRHILDRRLLPRSDRPHCVG